VALWQQFPQVVLRITDNAQQVSRLGNRLIFRSPCGAPILVQIPARDFVHSTLRNNRNPSTPKNKSNMSNIVPGSKAKSDSEWQAVLSPAQFRVIREKGTERPGTGEYDKFNKDGTYGCAACGTPLYKSTTKFNSGCGWPAFFDAIPGAVTRHEDTSLGMKRIEITCTACGGHLGHVFQGEGFPTPTDERHCVNSISLKFKTEDGKEA